MRPIPPLCCLLLAASAAAQWSQASTPTVPPSRTDAAMTYDPLRGQCVLFGGGPVTGINLRSDTWLYDGTDWTQASPANSPTGRLGAASTFDAARGVAVMFGGIASSISIALPSNQTWEWNGTDWAQATPAAAPTGRAYHGMAYDLVRQRTVMYGGSTNPGLLITSNQTWEYDGTTWAQTALTSPTNPGPRQFPAMCYHAGIARTVLFGGINPQTGGNSDTWLYDGSNWVLLPVAGTVPGPRNMPEMVFDSQRGVCVMQGGTVPSSGIPIDETWEFDGVSWQQVNTAQPTSRARFAMAYDEARQAVVTFGGSAPGNVAVTETWRYGAFVAELGAGCAGSNGVPVLTATAAPRLGGAVVTSLGNLANGAQFAAVAAGLFAANPPTLLDPFGLPGCTLWVNLDATVFLPVVGGVMTLSIGVPNSASLFGVTICEQGLSLDPGANAAGLVVSNAIQATLGW